MKYYDTLGNELYPIIADGNNITFYTDNSVNAFPIAGVDFKTSTLRYNTCKEIVVNCKPMSTQTFLRKTTGIQKYYFSFTNIPVGIDDDGTILTLNYQTNMIHENNNFYLYPDDDSPELNKITNNYNDNKYYIPSTYLAWQGSTRDAVTYIVLSQYGLIAFDTEENVLGIMYCIIGHNITESGEERGYEMAYYGFNPRYIGVGNGMRWQLHNLKVIGYTTKEVDNTPDTIIDGGYGSGDNPTDTIDIPSLPNVTITNSGVSLYALTSAQVQAFTGWLWTSDWTENIKKIRTDPMQNIIGISLLDYSVNGTQSTIHVGNLDTNVNCNIVNNWLTIDCGSITLQEYYGSFADYEPYIALTLYLPKVGFISIPADCVINNAIKVVYNIELISGEGLCYVYIVDTRDNFGYIYNTYTCHATASIPLSASDYTQQLLAIVNAGINSTVAVGGAIASGGVTAGNAIATVGSNALNVATTKNPTQTKGNFGNFGAIMCYKKPYIIINRTNLTKPSSFKENNGYLINYTSTIQGHTGFLKTIDYHCEFDAPYNHRTEIEKMLNEGVFING